MFFSKENTTLFTAMMNNCYFVLYVDMLFVFVVFGCFSCVCKQMLMYLLFVIQLKYRVGRRLCVLNKCANVEPIKIRIRSTGARSRLLWQYSVTRTEEFGVRVPLKFKRGVSLLKIA